MTETEVLVVPKAQTGKFKKHGFLDEAGGMVHVRPSLLHLVDDRHWARDAKFGDEENHS